MADPNRTDEQTLALLPLAWTRHTCDVCAGSGKIARVAGDRCPSCGGSRYLWTKVRWVPFKDQVWRPGKEAPAMAPPHAATLGDPMLYATHDDALAAREEQREDAEAPPSRDAPAPQPFHWGD